MQYRAFVSFATSPTQIPPYMKFLFVGPDFCRQLLSDLQSPSTPLLLANTSYCKVCSGLAPYSLLPCLTHKRNDSQVENRFPIDKILNYPANILNNKNNTAERVMETGNVKIQAIAIFLLFRMFAG